MPQVVDYSFSRPNPADLAAAGYVGAMRYLAPLPNAKVLTGDELATLQKNRLAVGLVYEGGASNTLAGAPQGTKDGKVARKQADELGFPMNRPIYAAVDTDVNTAQFDTIEEYLRAFGEQTGRPVGVYGEWAVVESMLDRGAATFAWQTAAWSHNVRSKRAVLFQRADAAAHPPAGCDVNDVLADDWGQWPAPSTSQPVPTPSEDDVLAQLVKKEGDGNVYVAGVGIQPRHVQSFKDADLCTLTSGVHIQPPPPEARKVPVTLNGETRDVWEVGPSGAELFGLG